MMRISNPYTVKIEPPEFTYICFACAVVLALTGCQSTGGATAAHVKFGVAGVFAVEKTATGIKVTEKTVRAADTETKIQILLFNWESSGKDVVLRELTPKEKAGQP